VVGDFNFTDQNAAYRILAEELSDAHRGAGWGLGHTFPAVGTQIGRVPFPPRLLRLDYVWHSVHWEVLHAEVGEWDGQSDHRPVFASLLLKSE
jgi:endonuclease/exonuclease/phosphatase (EEP) superfamily protein YafD